MTLPTVSGPVFLICLTLCAASRPANAQTRVYVSGDLFAEVTRLSRSTAEPEEVVILTARPRDGVTAGGGGRVGAFFSPEWSLELGADFGRAISDAETVSFPSPTLGLFIPPFQSRTSTRFSATSVLVGYHPPPRGRVHVGFRGGVSLMRTERVATTSRISTTFVSRPLPTLPGVSLVEPVTSVVTSEITTIAHGLTATLGAEAAIDVSRHFAVVPEMRVHAGGLGGFVLRPGVAARWMW